LLHRFGPELVENNILFSFSTRPSEIGIKLE
jgi:hypothetical protein